MELKPSYKDDLYLMHHGVKGMKWGVRRYQNIDGSLTGLGRIHYGVGKRYSRLNKTQKQDLKLNAANNGIKLKNSDMVDYISLNSSDRYDKTTGLLLKNKTESIDNDALKVNPQFPQKQKRENKNVYGTNCALCSATYCMRRKGYDVCAKPNFRKGGVTDEEINKFFINPQTDYANAACSNKLNRTNPYLSDNKVLNELYNMSMNHALYNERSYEKKCKEQGAKIKQTCESYGPNAYGIVAFRVLDMGGHAIAFENDSKGNTRFIDSQACMINGYKTGNDIYKREIQYADPYFGAHIVRCDNATPNYNLLKKQVVSNPSLAQVTRKNGETFDLTVYQDRSKEYGLA